MSNLWSDLPNARHIDWVIQTLGCHPKVWDAAWDAAWDASLDAARGAALQAAWDPTWYAAWSSVFVEARDAAYVAAQAASMDAAYVAACDSVYDAAQGAAWEAAWEAAWDAGGEAARWPAYHAARCAILALVAYDDAAKYLDMPIDRLRVRIALSGKPGAILLLPMAYVKEQLNEQCLVTLAQCGTY